VDGVDVAPTAPHSLSFLFSLLTKSSVSAAELTSKLGIVGAYRKKKAK
jgi:hypothetical protein